MKSLLSVWGSSVDPHKAEAILSFLWSLFQSQNHSVPPTFLSFSITNETAFMAWWCLFTQFLPGSPLSLSACLIIMVAALPPHLRVTEDWQPNAELTEEGWFLGFVAAANVDRKGSECVCSCVPSLIGGNRPEERGNIFAWFLSVWIDVFITVENA